jgi:hypothetical protein
VEETVRANEENFPRKQRETIHRQGKEEEEGGERNGEGE